MTRTIANSVREFHQNGTKHFLTQNAICGCGSAGEERTYKDILDARFTLTNVKRIENTDYADSIYGKVSDLKSPLQ